MKNSLEATTSELNAAYKEVIDASFSAENSLLSTLSSGASLDSAGL